MATDPNISRRRRPRRREAWRRKLSRFFNEPGPTLFIGGIVLLAFALTAAFTVSNTEPVEGVVVDTWTERHCSHNDSDPFPQAPQPPPLPLPDGNPFAIGLETAASRLDLAADCRTRLHAEVEYLTAEGEPAQGEVTYTDLEAVEAGDRVEVYVVWVVLFPSPVEAFALTLVAVLFVGGMVVFPVAWGIWAVGKNLEDWAWRRRYRNTR